MAGVDESVVFIRLKMTIKFPFYKNVASSRKKQQQQQIKKTKHQLNPHPETEISYLASCCFHLTSVFNVIETETHMDLFLI